VTRVLLIGAGPIGIELAVQLKRSGIDYEHVDAGPIGATITWYAPQTHFFSSPERIQIAGVPLQTLDQSKATREEYLTYLRAVVLQFDLQISTFERVLSIAPGFVVETTHGTRRAEVLVLAIGDMHRANLLGIPGEDLPHVSHYFGDPHVHFRRHVVIVGGRNSAVEAAIRCVRAGARVTMIHRAESLPQDHIKFWLYPEINGMIREGRIAFIPNATVTSIDRTGVTLSNGRRIVCDDVLLLTGYEQDTSLFEQAGIELVGPNRRPRFDERTMETNVRNIYVAGNAAAGTQVSGTREFIETAHVHVERIMAALKGSISSATRPAFEMPES
jgi:thioredoxin reductase (NADPH)